MGPLGMEQRHGDLHFHVWQVGAAFLAALVCSNGALSIQSAKPDAVSTGDVVAILTRAGGLASATRIAEGARVSRLERERIVLRTLCTRSSLQRDFIAQLSLTLHLLGIWDVDKEQAGDAYCDTLFQNRFSCTAREYAEVLFACWAQAARSCVLKPVDWFDSSIDKERNRCVAARVLDTLACPAGNVAQQISDQFSQFEADGLVQAWFASYPFVGAADDFFVAAPLPFLRLAASVSVFYQALALARQDADDEGSEKPWTNKYSSEMGRRFERFMHFLLAKARVSTDTIWEEYRYLEKDNALSPDFLVTNAQRPREVLIVQAKLKRLVPGAFYGFSLEDFERDAKGALAELVWKSIRYIYRIHVRPDTQLSQSHLALHDSIRRADSLALLGVVPSLPALFQAQSYRDLLWEGVAENLEEKERQWLATNQQRFSLWHVLDAEEICGFVGAREEFGNGESLLSALSDYLSAPGFGKLATTGGILSSFKDWYLMDRAPGAKGRIPELRRAFNEFCMATSAKFFPTNGVSDLPGLTT
jgi:hypothetical protein